MSEVIVKEFKPQPADAWSVWLKDSGYILKRKYWYSPDGTTRFCNLEPREHHAKWNSSHTSDGDYYWCPDCSDMQAG